MQRFTSPLNNLKVAKPCSESWEGMYGTDRKRMCGKCELNVYNLSEMTREEAERLIMNAEGRVCARFYRRADGTVITKDCPVGVKSSRKRTKRFWSSAASLVMALFAGIGFSSLVRSEGSDVVMGDIAVERPYDEPIMGNVAIDVPYAEMGEVAVDEEVMGRIAVDHGE